ncbi:MAG: carboxypeptidase-like regulatory domain-containing protein [Bryobacteraceae bacterium]
MRVKECGTGHRSLNALVFLLGLGVMTASVSLAQQASATVTGVVSDPSGAAVPSAQIALTNLNTSVVRSTTANNEGAYSLLNVMPGSYKIQASAKGFSTMTQTGITLEVNQTATFDFHLKVGEAQSTVTVEATAAAVESSTSELGAVVNNRDVVELPLNGRNFTQLLTITPGAVNINRDQSSGGGSGWAGNSIGNFTFPAINGAHTRSNLYLLDGINDLNAMQTIYNFAPIIDDIQEFKTQGHNDLAEYGGVAGGIVSVVSKSGTNEYHGTLWEFMRNEKMDARGFFQGARVPLRQNMYGIAMGGPLSIPKLYKGKNRSFVYAAWEGYKQRLANENGALAPTDAMRNGDFSAWGQQLYDPYTTSLNAATGAYSRNPIVGNILPSSEINPVSQLYQTLIPHAGAMINGNNLFVHGKSATNQDAGSLRADQYIGNSDQIMFRYSEYAQLVNQPGGTIGISTWLIDGHNWASHETHTFGPTAILDAYFGRNWGWTMTGAHVPGEDTTFVNNLKSLGVSQYWSNLHGTQYTPQFSANGYVGLSPGSQTQGSVLADTWQGGGTFAKIWGKHTIKVGADFSTNNMLSPIGYAGESFSSTQTAGLGANQGVGGNSYASLLLGVPTEASYRNVTGKNTGGWDDSFFIQDQWKVTSRLTVNLGFRNDMVFFPISNSPGKDLYTGDANPMTGQYILNALPPPCSATVGNPCIPNGIYTSSSTPALASGLPPHVVVTPNSNHRIIQNSLADWAGRVGLAYRINDKMVARAGYGRFYDTWGTVMQLAQNFAGNWPNVATIENPGLNQNIPTAKITDPLGLGTGGAIIYPASDFSSVSQWMVDPGFRTPYMDQWNFGIQRELPSNTVLDANYVGSVGRHLDWGPVMNVATPGPGDPKARQPFPYMLPQWFDQSTGNSRYNALQVSLNKRLSHGMTFLVSYTLSHSNDDGCTLGANCNVSNPYNRAFDAQTSDLNQKNVFSASFSVQSPFSKSSNKLTANLAGGWMLNGILQLHSGNPYSVTTSTSVLNNGGYNQERADLVSSSGGFTKSINEWFNTSAYAIPAPYTYGNSKPNSLVTDWGRNLDLSLFRQFHIGLGEKRFFEFRAEAFNVFNNVVFSYPDSNIGDTNYGRVTGQMNIPRELQLALKFYF